MVGRGFSVNSGRNAMIWRESSGRLHGNLRFFVTRAGQHAENFMDRSDRWSPAFAVLRTISASPWPRCDSLAGQADHRADRPEEQARYLAALPKIDPNPVHEHEEPKVADEATEKPGPAPASSYAWYWDKVPTGLGEASDRFDLALASLSDGPNGAAVGASRLQHMQEVADEDGKDILRARRWTRALGAIVLAVIGIESAGRPDAVSSAGAVGLMQLIPATAERFVEGFHRPCREHQAGSLTWTGLLKEFDNDPAPQGWQPITVRRGARQRRRAVQYRDVRGTMCRKSWPPGAGGTGALRQPAPSW